MKEGLRNVCTELSVKISEQALGLIAANADGSVRDGLSLLDQCISGGNNEVSREDVLEFLGTSGEEVFLELTDSETNRCASQETSERCCAAHPNPLGHCFAAFSRNERF